MSFLAAMIGSTAMLFVLSMYHSRIKKQAPYKHVVFGLAAALFMFFFPPTVWYRGTLFFTLIVLLIRYMYRTGSFSASVQGFLLFVVMLLSTMFSTALNIWLRGVFVDYRRLFAVNDWPYIVIALALMFALGYVVHWSLTYSNRFFDRLKYVQRPFFALNILLAAAPMLFLRFHVAFSVAMFPAASAKEEFYMTMLLFFVGAVYLAFAAMANKMLILGGVREERPLR